MNNNKKKNPISYPIVRIQYNSYLLLMILFREISIDNFDY